MVEDKHPESLSLTASKEQAFFLVIHHTKHISESALLFRSRKRSCKIGPGSRKVLLVPKHVL